ncbi:AP-3 complex subunit delta [Aduncisulcus paluster]|uniref:AP-3 complex subunit delta n=1 Tax=Aduncisulcus paluster TaxID=2918883 RepID=A0ABQ5K2B2_9EUKA|nr:AP-3 complex subunit delta [Aduncisulcus paluster]
MKTLPDLIKGIRAHRGSEEEYIGKAIQEAKDEIRSLSIDEKCTGIQKLWYLQMLGYDMEFAGFHVVELISSTQFRHKRIGYLASSFCFTDDFCILSTAQFRKDITSRNQYECGVALSALASVANADMSQALMEDVLGLFNSSRPYIRKKAVLTAYRLLLKDTEAIRTVFPALKRRLDAETDPSVLHSVVNVLTELVLKEPKNFLGLVPSLFTILNHSSSNWTLIKVVRLLGVLCDHEPRLPGKLEGPLTQHLQNTAAKSLTFEIINVAVTHMLGNKSLLKICTERLAEFISPSSSGGKRDANLCYLSLDALSKIAAKYPRVAAAHNAALLACLTDDVYLIRIKALDIISSLFTRKNIKDIVARLLQFVDETKMKDETAAESDTATEGKKKKEKSKKKRKKHGLTSEEERAFKCKVVDCVVSNSCKENYNLITDFAWLIEILTKLGATHSSITGSTIATHLRDVAVRVPEVQSYAVELSVSLLTSSRLSSDAVSFTESATLFSVTAWLLGEYANEIDSALVFDVVSVLMSQCILSLPTHTQAACVNAALKVCSRQASKVTSDVLDDCIKMIRSRLSFFVSSASSRVQERAVLVDVLLNEDLATVDDLFAPELVPVSSKKQKKVKLGGEGNFEDLIVPIELQDWEGTGKEKEAADFFGHAKTTKDPAFADDVFDDEEPQDNRVKKTSGKRSDDIFMLDDDIVPEVPKQPSGGDAFDLEFDIGGGETKQTSPSQAFGRNNSKAKQLSQARVTIRGIEEEDEESEEDVGRSSHAHSKTEPDDLFGFGDEGDLFTDSEAQPKVTEHKHHDEIVSPIAKDEDDIFGFDEPADFEEQKQKKKHKHRKHRKHRHKTEEDEPVKTEPVKAAPKKDEFDDLFDF